MNPSFRAIQEFCFMSTITHKPFRTVLDELPPETMAYIGMNAGYIDISPIEEFKNEAYTSTISKKLYQNAIERRKSAMDSFERVLASAAKLAGSEPVFTVEEMVTRKKENGEKIDKNHGITKTMELVLLAGSAIRSLHYNDLRRLGRRQSSEVSELKERKRRILNRAMNLMDTVTKEVEVLDAAARDSDTKPITFDTTMRGIVTSYSMYCNAVEYQEHFVDLLDRRVSEMYPLRVANGIAIILDGNERGPYWFLEEKTGDIEPRLELEDLDPTAKKKKTVKKKIPVTQKQIIENALSLGISAMPGKINAGTLHSFFGFPRHTATRLMQDVEFPTVRSGRRSYVTREDFWIWLNKQANADAAAQESSTTA